MRLGFWPWLYFWRAVRLWSCHTTAQTETLVFWTEWSLSPYLAVKFLCCVNWDDGYENIFGRYKALHEQKAELLNIKHSSYEESSTVSLSKFHCIVVFLFVFFLLFFITICISVLPVHVRSLNSLWDFCLFFQFDHSHCLVSPPCHNFITQIMSLLFPKPPVTSLFLSLEALQGPTRLYICWPQYPISSPTVLLDWWLSFCHIGLLAFLWTHHTTSP